MSKLADVITDLEKKADKKKAKILSGFFKTGKSQYGHGDIFIGVKVPEQRIIAKRHANLSLENVSALLKSKIHEHRLTGLMILQIQYNKAKNEEKEKLAQFYLDHIASVNNWDLVDCSAPHILGHFIYHHKPQLVQTLHTFSKSDDLWKKRISVVATQYFIRQGRFSETLTISQTLLKDKHDLIHKACGWMLREVGKKNRETEEEFLKKHHKTMPRTMLRYAIEHFEKDKKAFYMKK